MVERIPATVERLKAGLRFRQTIGGIRRPYKPAQSENRATIPENRKPAQKLVNRDKPYTKNTETTEGTSRNAKPGK